MHRWLPIADATWQEWPERPNCGHFQARRWRTARSTGADVKADPEGIFVYEDEGRIVGHLSSVRPPFCSIPGPIGFA